MSESFNPPTHDVDRMNRDQANSKHFFSMFINYADKGKDIYMTQMGYKTIFDLLSSKALQDFDKYSPDKIDKFTDIQKLTFAKTFYGAMQHSPTNEDWKNRRAAFTKSLGLNYSSRFINLMLKHAKDTFDKWEEGEEKNFIPIINNFTLSFMCSIILGSDFDEKFGMLNYTHQDGRVERCDLYTFFPILGKDLIKAMMKPYNLIFPTLVEYNIGT